MKVTLENRIKNIKNKLQNNPDVNVREINVGGSKVALIFIDEMTNTDAINENIINPLNKFDGKVKTLDDISANIVHLCQVEKIGDDEIVNKVLRGFTVLLLDGNTGALCLNTIEYFGRSVEEPPTSTVVNGPREGFTENLKTNLTLIRKRLISSNLKIEEVILGRETKTRVDILYLTNIADKEVVKMVKDKLAKVDIDGIIDSFYITKFLEDKPRSIFRQAGNCEKPDVATAKMLEGRIIVLVDGSPIAITLPYVMFEDFQSSNDYYSDAHRVSMLRFIRVLGLFISIFLPGMYIALQLYHYKVLPLKFLVTIVNTTQNLPLNPFLEIFFIIILFDILFEASVRMPKYLGMAISIVGALILGDTAVKAGLVSPPGVMIVAMSAITVYIIPNQSSQISILRIVFALIGGTLGFHGVILGLILMVSYLCNFDSFKTPYLAPYTPFVLSDQKDFIQKGSLIDMTVRPKSIPHKNSVRQRRKREQ